MRLAVVIFAVCVIAAGFTMGRMLAAGLAPRAWPFNPVMSLIEHGEKQLHEGKLDAAGETFRRAIDWAASSRGTASADFARANDDMAALSVVRKRYAEAATYAERSVKAYESAFGPESRCLGRVLGLLGDIHYQRAELEQAQLIYKRAVLVLQRCDGSSGSAETACAMRALGRCLIAMKREAEAKPYMAKSFRMMQLVYGKRRRFSPLDNDESPRLSGGNAI